MGYAETRLKGPYFAAAETKDAPWLFKVAIVSMFTKPSV